MKDKLTKLLEFIKKLHRERYTGQVTIELNFNEGGITRIKKIETLNL